MSTMLCSWRLCPSPGMYAVTSMPLTSRTRATLRSAEFGFLGVVVYTRVHTPRFCGLFRIAGDLLLERSVSRPLRTSWLIVGIRVLKTLGDEKTQRRPESLRRREPKKLRDRLRNVMAAAPRVNPGARAERRCRRAKTAPGGRGPGKTRGRPAPAGAPPGSGGPGFPPPAPPGVGVFPPTPHR